MVSLSYGPSWLLAPNRGAKQSGLLDDLMAKLPAVEPTIGALRQRIVLGEAMGGPNVLVAGLSCPDRSDKVAALCPHGPEKQQAARG
ncbi:MAG: hypothetical protein ACJLS3_04825 [Erythrobacter sp.]